MKKLILSGAVFITFFSCKESPSPKANTASIKVADSTVNIDSAKNVKPDLGFGIGLTQEEMADDSVLTDGSVPTSWEVAGITDIKGFKLFLKRLQLLVLNNDKEELAKLIKYPLNRQIRTAEDFIRQYDRVFSKDAKLSVAKINFSQIFRNSKGVMTEDGFVWFAQDGDEFKIIAINKR